MADQLPYLSVNRHDRPWWSHDHREGKTDWRGQYSSGQGTVLVGATLPWKHDHTGKEMPGYVWYEIHVRGLNVNFHEPFYRTPRGACIIAGRLLRTLMAVPGKRPLDVFRKDMKQRWQQEYGIQLT